MQLHRASRAEIATRQVTVLAMLSNDFNQNEIALQLHVSQPTISRDIQRLDEESKRVDETMAKLHMKDSPIMIAFSQLDAAIVRAFEEYDRLEGVEKRSRLQALRILLGLLARKCYLISFLGLQSSWLQGYHKTLERQYLELRTRVDNIQNAS